MASPEGPRNTGGAEAEGFRARKAPALSNAAGERASTLAKLPPRPSRLITERGRFRVGETRRTESGAVVSVHPLERKKKRKPSIAGRHEAIHFLIADETGTGVTSSEIANDNESGVTKMASPNPLAAIGPHADGDTKGSGSDRQKVFLMGHDERVLAPMAKKIISDNDEHINEIGRELDNRRRMSGPEMKGVRRQVEAEQYLVNNAALVKITGPDGTEKKVITPLSVDKKEVKIPVDMLPNRWYETKEMGEASPDNISQEATDDSPMERRIAA